MKSFDLKQGSSHEIRIAKFYGLGEISRKWTSDR